MSSAADAGRRNPRTRSRSGSGVTPYVFILPFVILFAAFLVAPLIVAIVNSLYATQHSGLGFSGGGTTSFVWFKNYVSALTDTDFIRGFGRVLLFGIVQVPVMLGLALLFALITDTASVRFTKSFQLAVFLPYAVPGVVAALIWGFLYQPGVSPIVQGLRGIGIPVNFLTPGTVLWAIANVSTWGYVGVNMIIMYGALQAIPKDVLEAARIDGAGALRTAFAIKIPLIAPSILLTCLFSIIGTVQLFNEPQVLRTITSNVTANYTPNMAIYQTTMSTNDLNLGSAMAIVLGIVTFILSIGVSRMSTRGAGA